MNTKREKTDKLRLMGKLLGLWAIFLVLLCSPWVRLHAQSTYSYFRTVAGVPVFPNLSSAPTTAGAGLIYFNTTDKNLYWYDGTQWVAIGSSGSSSVPTAGAVAVSGTIYIGNSLTGTYIYNDPLGVLEGSGTTASSYQWYYATDASGTDKTAISGATTTSYILASPVSSGKYLAFSVKPRSALGITGAETLSAWNRVYSGGITASVSLTSNPVLYQTQVVSSMVGYAYAGGVSSGTCAESGATYKWYRNSSASTSGAATITSGSGTPSSYTVLSSDVGQYIGLGVTPNSTCNASAPEVIGWKQVSVLTPVYATATISGLSSGAALNSTTITAVKGTYSVMPAIAGTEGTPTYQWYYAADASGTGKTAMTGQTASTHAVNIAGGYGYNSTSYYLAVGIIPKTVSGETGTEVLSSWAQVQANQAPVASNVTQSGTLQAGSTLTGSYSYSDTEGNSEGTSIYQWYLATNSSGGSASPISGATSKTYIIRSIDSGYYLGFSVTPVAGSGTTTGTKVTTGTYSGPVINQAPVASNVSQSGSYSVGSTLTGSYLYSDTEGNAEGSSSYQWYRAGNSSGASASEINGATAKTYIITTSDNGYYLGFSVTPVASSGTITGTNVIASTYGGPVINQAPVANNVTQLGNYNVGSMLTGSYSYSDTEGNSEGTSTYQWYRATSSSGSGASAISGATSKTYVITRTDNGYYLGFSVTPVASSGTTTGSNVITNSYSVISAITAPDGTIVVEFTSPSGRTFMDCNLGAEQAPTSSIDYLAYGSLFQWCRAADGHEKITWTSSSLGTPVTTTTVAGPVSTTAPGHSMFILADSNSPYDWLTPQNDGSLWWNGSSGGVNNPCATGFHVLTKAEWEAEFNSTSTTTTAYNNLRLMAVGQRSASGGYVSANGMGMYWTSTSCSNGLAYYILIMSNGVMISTASRAAGFSVRCIKN